MSAKLVGLGVAWAPGEAAYLPIAHNQPEQLDWDLLLAKLQPIFAGPERKKLAHNPNTTSRSAGAMAWGRQPIHDDEHGLGPRPAGATWARRKRCRTGLADDRIAG